MKQRNDWSMYKDVKDIQDLVDRENIRTSSEFYRKYKGLACKLNRMGKLIKDLNFPDSKKKKIGLIMIHLRKYKNI